VVCLVSPVNAYLRYAMPYMALSILLLAHALREARPTADKQAGSDG
jgi:hypothetical protein